MADSADLAVRLYAAAGELETLYAYCDWALRQSFPQSAAGEYLDYHAQLRGITRKAGTKAEGSIRFSIDTPRQSAVLIPKGTVCTNAGLVRFVTVQDATIAAGSTYADAPAQAEQAGTAGNTASGSICYMTQAPSGVSGCSNQQAFSGGQDDEDDEALRQRVLKSYSRLPNGANAAYYEENAMAHEGVESVNVLPRSNGIGTVGVVVATAPGFNSSEILTQIQQDLDAAREIGVDVTVSAPQNLTVNLSLKLWPADNATFEEAKQAVEAAIGGYFTGRLLGKPVYLSALGNLIYETGLVKNYKITAPAADVEVAAGQLPKLGTLSVTQGA